MPGRHLEGLEPPRRVEEPLGQVSAVQEPPGPERGSSWVLLPSWLCEVASGTPGSKGWAQGLGQRRWGPT